jgi:hypothetical protein
MVPRGRSLGSGRTCRAARTLTPALQFPSTWFPSQRTGEQAGDKTRDMVRQTCRLCRFFSFSRACGYKIPREGGLTCKEVLDILVLFNTGLC